MDVIDGNLKIERLLSHLTSWQQAIVYAMLDQNLQIDPAICDDEMTGEAKEHEEILRCITLWANSDGLASRFPGMVERAKAEIKRIRFPK